MGKINNYQTETPNPGDKMLTSDATTGETKNVTVQSVADLGRSSKVYRAFLTQTGLTAPVATVVDGNTIIGAWSYTNVGQYTFTSNGSFDSVNAACIVGVGTAEEVTYEFSVVNDNSVLFKTHNSGTLANSLLAGLYIEITTYDI